MGTSPGPAIPATVDGHSGKREGTSPREALAAGAIFRNLTIHSVLGRGAMGTAYLASHPILQVPHVIKTFHGATDLSIFREAYLGARVSSPQVVSVLDAGIEGPVAFAVQQYVDGIDLGELLATWTKEGRKLPLELVIHLVRDTARGLHALHQAGVVHCDVKPANLFLAANGAAMVGDFGIASDTRMVQARRGISGTPLFMAPELWNEKPPDRRSDLYALGATAQILATGQPPFVANSAAGLCIAHVSDPYVPPTARTPREAYFYSVVERLLRKDPSERYASAEALSRDLALIEEAPPQIDSVSADRAHIGDLRVALSVGDLSAHTADVIVNAANTSLAMDVGVAAALRRAGGEELAAAATAQGPAAMGDVVWTPAGRLKARHVAHAVAALGGAICLGRATLRTLLGSEARQARRVAFPALGTGVGHVPPALAAKLMLEAIVTFARLKPRSVELIDLVLFDDAIRHVFREVMHAM